MMYHVVGIRKGMSFNTKEGGEMSGLKLHLTCPDDRVEGMATDSFFISSKSACYQAALSLHRYGKIDAIVNK